MSKRVFMYRPIMLDGVTHGGGGAKFGEWRRTYDQATTDLLDPSYRLAHGDGHCGIEVCRMPATVRRIGGAR